eukprot:TRINITY_DN1853_c1_g1_i2.p3 TRINITY_DN1853_c1_g1~~TRINITY_DN1853_c1_g1_i2.p3  ORF type:complete len:104 (-),score=12.76 TRINITY_DN1853_c1_g1_i2:18-329(-)
MDYLLGLADLTGEVMRLAISAAGFGEMEALWQASAFIQQIHNGFLGIRVKEREMANKMEVMTQSVQKVEAACLRAKMQIFEESSLLGNSAENSTETTVVTQQV